MHSIYTCLLFVLKMSLPTVRLSSSPLHSIRNGRTQRGVVQTAGNCLSRGAQVAQLFLDLRLYPLAAHRRLRPHQCRHFSSSSTLYLERPLADLVASTLGGVPRARLGVVAH